ncbi:hypothetical protein GHK92_13605 [Nocardioides sp. dk4132]|uniref:VanZ family protein n=1 Tax=unclassified Nocardioides TaxID=2615069 RepID=UPI0012975B30|nr:MULTISPECIES: VanZ family protein [unclassified Nocardioides]MQW76911.1 hypothetical protein [Nocardioides sp. dk4132]
MFPVGGVEVMLLGVVLSGLVCLGLAAALRPFTGTRWALLAGGLCWSLAVIACVTLLPADSAPGIVPAETRSETCSWDVGGPAPDGFWIFSGGQRLLNALVFVPAGALLVLALARWPRLMVLTVPVGLVALGAYSVGIEIVQLELARLDRACDATDMVDNATGAVLGGLLGLGLAPLVRPWRSGRRRRA